MMKIASITITSQRSNIIGDALRSVSDIVDIMLLVDLGIDDATLKVAAEIAGKRLRIVKSDAALTCADWRNTGIKESARLGADWAIMLDTDMRLIFNGIDVRAVLNGTNLDCIMMLENTGIYMKDIFFKLPFHGEYVGHTHEMLINCSNNAALLNVARFTELPKTKEQLQSRIFTSDIPNLLKQINDMPKIHRWRYYLGQTYENLGYYDLARIAYLDASEYGIREERAWALLRAGICAYFLGNYDISIQYALRGLVLDGNMSELPYLMALCALKLKLKSDAENYARQAIRLGLYKTAGIVHRGPHNIPSALWEGPYKILCQLYPDDEKLKSEAIEAEKRRVAWQKGY